jgi:hypothetical protein
MSFSRTVASETPRSPVSSWADRLHRGDWTLTSARRRCLSTARMTWTVVMPGRTRASFLSLRSARARISLDTTV